MKLPLSWLQRWFAQPLPLDAVVETLTFGGHEVDDVQLLGPDVANIIVAQVQDVAAHPQADTLRVCAVKTGSGPDLQIVCGAPNVRVGMKAALALPGAVIEGKKLKKSKLRGVESQGMLCSLRELGLGQEHDGIVELEPVAVVGESIERWLPVRDYILEINITPNRGDCLSVLGLSRDLAALSPHLDYQPMGEADVTFSAELDEICQVSLEAPEACPLFVGCVVRDIDARQPSPAWLVERLERAGLRPVDAVVDITNYVMMELGQPMHAYDLGQIEGGIRVRTAQSGEVLHMLDGSEQKLCAGELVIADQSKVLGIAGVMGGRFSGISAQTRNVFLEAAHFHPDTVRGVARARGLSSEAAYRFERGVDWGGAERAMKRAVNLLLRISGGRAGPVHIEKNDAALPQRDIIALDLRRVEMLSGLKIGGEVCHVESSRLKGYLNRLGCSVEFGQCWQVLPPTWRPDINLDVDLIEEIVRLYGYANVPEQVPQGALAFNDRQDMEPWRRCCDALCSAGFYETINFSFVSEQQERAFRPSWVKHVVRVSNPIAQDTMSVMRSSLLPGLLLSVQRNVTYQHRHMRFFETGRVFGRDETGVYHERDHVAGVIVESELFQSDWQGVKAPYGFYDLKADVQNIIGTAEFSLIDANDCAFLETGKSALFNAPSMRHPGFCGFLSSQLRKLLDLEDIGDVWVFECVVPSLVHQFSYKPINLRS